MELTFPTKRKEGERLRENKHSHRGANFARSRGQQIRQDIALVMLNILKCTKLCYVTKGYEDGGGWGSVGTFSFATSSDSANIIMFLAYIRNAQLFPAPN